MSSDTSSNSSSSEGRHRDDESEDSFMAADPSMSVPATSTNKAMHRQLQQERLVRDTLKKENAMLERRVADLTAREQVMRQYAIEGGDQWTEQQRQIANLKLTLHQ
eukprot:392687_1